MGIFSDILAAIQKRRDNAYIVELNHPSLRQRLTFRIARKAYEKAIADIRRIQSEHEEPCNAQSVTAKRVASR